MAPSQALPPSNEPQFYPVPPIGPPSGITVSGYLPQDPGFAPPPFQPQPENSDMYAGANQQQFVPSSPRGQMSPHMPPQVPHTPALSPSHIMPPSPGHMPHVDQPFQAPPEMQTAQPMPSSPVTTGSLTPKIDFFDQMAHMVSVCPKSSIIFNNQPPPQSLSLCIFFNSVGSWKEVKDNVAIIGTYGALVSCVLLKIKCLLIVKHTNMKAEN